MSLPGLQSPLPCLSQYADDTSVIASSDQAIVSVFDTYDLYERGSGSQLNLSKSKGLWLGPWNGRSDSPVAIDWSSMKIKVLRVFLGPLDLEEDNWRPRLSAVENVLLSWHQCALSFRGKAHVINALALSRIWYVASLIHMLSWVLRELNSLLFKFFWKGKPDLVSRAVVVQPNCCGGFSVVDVNLKVSALLLQWIRRFASSPSSWVSFLVYWFNPHLGLSPVQVFANPPVFDVNLPPFYVSLLCAWRLAGGSASPAGVCMLAEELSVVRSLQLPPSLRTLCF